MLTISSSPLIFCLWARSRVSRSLSACNWAVRSLSVSISVSARWRVVRSISLSTEILCLNRISRHSYTDLNFVSMLKRLQIGFFTEPKSNTSTSSILWIRIKFFNNHSWKYDCSSFNLLAQFQTNMQGAYSIPTGLIRYQTVVVCCGYTIVGWHILSYSKKYLVTHIGRDLSFYLTSQSQHTMAVSCGCHNNISLFMCLL